MAIEKQCNGQPPVGKLSYICACIHPGCIFMEGLSGVCDRSMITLHLQYPQHYIEIYTDDLFF